MIKQCNSSQLELYKVVPHEKRSQRASVLGWDVESNPAEIVVIDGSGDEVKYSFTSFDKSSAGDITGWNYEATDPKAFLKIFTD